MHTLFASLCGLCFLGRIEKKTLIHEVFMRPSMHGSEPEPQPQPSTRAQRRLACIPLPFGQLDRAFTVREFVTQVWTAASVDCSMRMAQRFQAFVQYETHWRLRPLVRPARRVDTRSLCQVHTHGNVCCA